MRGNKWVLVQNQTQNLDPFPQLFCAYSHQENECILLSFQAKQHMHLSFHRCSLQTRNSFCPLAVANQREPQGRASRGLRCFDFALWQTLKSFCFGALINTFNASLVEPKDRIWSLQKPWTYTLTEKIIISVWPQNQPLFADLLALTAFFPSPSTAPPLFCGSSAVMVVSAKVIGSAVKHVKGIFRLNGSDTALSARVVDINGIQRLKRILSSSSSIYSCLNVS